MAYLIKLRTFSDNRGNLTVLENEVPFPIKRIFYIYGVDDSVRGGHRHKQTIQAAICLQGSCTIHSTDGRTKEEFVLDSPDKCVILEPADWHTIDQFKKGSILMILASEYFDPMDYIWTSYE